MWNLFRNYFMSNTKMLVMTIAVQWNASLILVNLQCYTLVRIHLRVLRDSERIDIYIFLHISAVVHFDGHRSVFVSAKWERDSDAELFIMRSKVHCCWTETFLEGPKLIMRAKKAFFVIRWERRAFLSQDINRKRRWSKLALEPGLIWVSHKVTWFSFSWDCL